MAVNQITRIEIASLADRLEARGESLLMNDTPELQRDLRAALTYLGQSATNPGLTKWSHDP